jgi:predicted nucleic acid-binding protein
MTNSAVFDACVLYSAPLRDFLLWLGYAGLVRPIWSEEIRSEWINSLLLNRPDLQREKLERTCREMDFHFPDAFINGFKSIVPTLRLPDPKDRHVLAVAVHAEAEYIITLNLKDFPNTILQLYNVEAVTPDEFVSRLIQKIPGRVLEVARFHRSRLSRPPKAVGEYLATLEKQGLPKTVTFLRKHEGDI